VGEPVELLGHDAHELRMVMPEREHPGSGQESMKNIAVDVTDEAPRRLIDATAKCRGYTRTSDSRSVPPDQEFGGRIPGSAR
jgi:hypothetical protein